MRQLLPTPIESVDPLDLYPHDDRPAPAGRPWLLVNMIASVDGATALDGVSGGLGGDADKAVFRAIRASCDAVLVGSSTLEAERYRMPSRTPEIAAGRRAAGRADAPGLVVMTASGRIDPTVPAFAARDADEPRPLVITGQDADGDALAELNAEVVRLDAPTPEPVAVLAILAQRGHRVVLSEGGPNLNGRLQAAGVIDEVCLSVSPTLVGGDSARIVAAGDDGASSGLHLARLLEADGMLFARYIRA